MMDSNGYSVELKNVSYSPSWASTKKILNNLSLRINPGDFIAVLGFNGAGKSSILRAIMGEIDTGIEGTITINNSINVIDQVDNLIDGVAIVHQNSKADLHENLSVGQNILLRQISGSSYEGSFFNIMSKYWKTEVAEQLNKFVLQDSKFHLDEKVKNLSGGQKQMLSLIIAIHLEHKRNKKSGERECKLLLLDEHTKALDPFAAENVMELTAKLINETKVTTVMVTHDYEQAIKYSSRIAIIDDGVVKFDQPTAKKMTPYELRRLVYDLSVQP